MSIARIVVHCFGVYLGFLSYYSHVSDFGSNYGALSIVVDLDRRLLIERLSGQIRLACDLFGDVLRDG